MKIRFPIAVTHNGVIAKIHRSFQTQNGKKYDDFLVVYHENGRRKRLRRSTLGAAQIAAKNACNGISMGEHLTLELKNGERQMYMRAIEPLRAIGAKLDVVTLEYANAVKRLPTGATIQDAVDFFCRRRPVIQEKCKVAMVVEEMLNAKRAANLSEVHLKDLESRLDRFAEDFQMTIGDVAGKMIQAWLDAMNVKGRTKQNYLRAVAALFRFAIRRKYLAKDAVEEIESVEPPKQDASEIEIFKPAEMQEILSIARPEMVPWLAIAGFAGLRSAEINRLDWSEINLRGQFIEIKAAKSKTAARRIVPITDNLAKWLKPHAKESGLVRAFDSWWNQIGKTAQAVNAKRKADGIEKVFVWRHNALRHSFCSYRLAAIKNTAQVALEAGNSPQMIFQHYRQVVTESEAGKWFSIAPSRN